MIRPLQVTLIIFGVIVILLGLAFIVIPELLASTFGFGEIADYVTYVMAMLGISFIAPGVWLIVAGRDPLRHIAWVKFAILWSALGVVAGSFSIIQGAVNFSQAGPGIILDGVFMVALLVFYPYRAARSGQ